MLGVINSFDVVRGLPLSEFRVVEKESDLNVFRFPCYLKADVVGHKSEMGAVFRCDSFEDARKNFLVMRRRFPKEKLIVQESFEGVEMIVGVKSDVVFGKLLVVGFGGVFTEVKRDVSFRALPVSRRDIVSMIKELKGVGVFRARGKKYDVEKFVTLIESVIRLVERKGIKELDLNPVIVGEKGSRIVDVRVELD